MAAAAWSREGGTVRFALGVLIPLAAALMQGTVVPLVAIGDARPSLPILVAGAWAVAAGAREAVWWAFLGGLATDLLSGGPLGAFALASSVPNLARLSTFTRRSGYASSRSARSLARHREMRLAIVPGGIPSAAPIV